MGIEELVGSHCGADLLCSKQQKNMAKSQNLEKLENKQSIKQKKVCGFYAIYIQHYFKQLQFFHSS